MPKRTLKVLLFVLVFMGHAFASFVAWTMAPGNSTVDGPWAELRHIANLLFEFPLFNLLPASLLNAWFEVAMLVNSALCAAVLVWLWFWIFRKRLEGSKL